MQFSDFNRANVLVTGRVLSCLSRTAETVFLDYIALEDVVTCVWSPICTPDSHIAFGFLADSTGNPNAQLGQHQCCEYHNNGVLKIRNHMERVDTFTSSDTIRIELDMQRHTAAFFKNEMFIPVAVVRVPTVLRFYVTITGQNTNVTLQQIAVLRSATPLNPSRREFAYDDPNMMTA